MLYYFAYGSNLHPLRLKQRTPSAQLVDAGTLRHYRLAFHKRGSDGSGKCNLICSGVAEDVVHGAIYRLPRHERLILDRYEGPGYRLGYVLASVDDQSYRCFTYLARKSHINAGIKPYDWYCELVLLGAKEHGFPPGYITRIAMQDAVSDLNHGRTSKNRRLLQNMLNYR